VFEANTGEGPGTNTGLSVTSPAAEEESHSNGARSLSAFQQRAGELATTNSAVVKSPVDLGTVSDYTDSPLHAHIKDHGFYIKVMMSSQATRLLQAQSIMKHLAESMAREISEDKYQLIRMSELVHEFVPCGQEGIELQPAIREKGQRILERQHRIFHAQQQSIDRLTAIQKCVQDTATLAFAAIVHPVPRLFIVLPVTATFSSLPDGSYRRPVLNFRLFFLCEHDLHSTADYPAPPLNVHLARHEGYELQDADKFFQIYTPYILSMIYILKNGISSPRISIPNLSHTMLTNGLDEVQDILNLSRNTIQSLMNETMSYIRSRGYDSSINRMSRSPLGVIDSADLRSVVKYLRGYKRKVGRAKGWISTTDVSFDVYRPAWLLTAID